MTRDRFPAGVAEQLKWYVYRLIDPRNGETFYVGKGRGNRIFAHASGDFKATVGHGTTPLDGENSEDETDLKIRRINEIRATGLEVGHIVHRHGMSVEDVAYEVEAALIDAYPGLTNQVAGHESGVHGSRHVEEIVLQYAAEEFTVREPLMLIYIGRHLDHYGDPYETVRCAWKVNVERARRYHLVLAHANGLVVGAYRPSKWLAGTRQNFPGRLDDDSISQETGRPTRWGFNGEPAERDAWSIYVGKRIPEQYRAKQNPVQYCDPDC